MLKLLKSIGNGTEHEYQTDEIVALSLPPRRSSKNTTFTHPRTESNKNIWYDKQRIKYSLKRNTLTITSNDYFSETIIDYINAIPANLNLDIILEINTSLNETAGFNMLCDAFSRIPTNREVILNITNMRFGNGVALNIESLPSNVKVSNVIDNKEQQELPFYGDNSFDYWILNCNDRDYETVISKLTPKSRQRAIKLRNIAFNFYRFVPEEIKKASIKEKSDYTYHWCCQNIEYDFGGTMPDGSFNYERRDTQDPIMTFERRKGVCAGRAALLKILLNNYYMRVPCFLTLGMAENLQHEWNEVIDENGAVFEYDISKQRNKTRKFHDDFEMTKPYLKIKKGNNLD